MKKDFVAALAAFGALSCILLSTGAAGAIEENFEPIYPNDEMYDSETSFFFSKIRKDEIYTLDNYREAGRSAGANIDKITRKDIERQNNASVSDLLNQVGSVTTNTANGSEGSVTSLRIRGTDRVRLMVDGIRADRPSLTSPGVETQFLLSDDIEFIEVIKGPQGNVLGTNASGGAVNMQTRRGEGPIKIEIGSDMGNYGVFKERFAVMGGDEKADYYLSTTWYKTDGGMRTKNFGRLYNDGYNNLNVVSNFGYRLLDNRAELRNVFRFSRAEKDIAMGYNGMTGESYNSKNSYAENFDIMESLSFKHFVNDLYDYNLRFGLYHNKNNNNILPDSIAPDESSISKISSTRLNFMTQHNVKIKDWNTFSIGYNLENEYIDGSSDSLSYGYWPNYFPLGHYVSNYSGNSLQNDVYVNDVINIKDRFYLRGGARLLSNNEYGTYVTPNASAALILPTFKIKGAETKFRGSFGQSVNTPTLYQRYGELVGNGWYLVGNPDLGAEKLTSFDAGIEQSFFDEKLKFEFGYFNSDYKDYIAYLSPDWVKGYYDNIDKATIQGYEGKVTYEPNDKFKFLVNYTYTDSEDKRTGFSLPATPKSRLNGMVYFTPNERLSLYAGVEAGSARTMSSSSNEKAPGYVDAKIGTKVKLFSLKGLDVFLKGNIYNLFNQDICMYKASYPTDYYYGPKIRFMTGIFMEYNGKKKDKNKERV